MYINGSGQLGTLTSSRRFKDHIQTMGSASESLLALHPVTFLYKPEIDPKRLPQWGLIAEEVNAVNPGLVVRDDKGAILTVRYEQVNAMLLNEFLKDHRRADAKDVEIAALTKRVAELEARDKERTQMQKRLVELEARDKQREERLAKLEQFIPAAAATPKVQNVTLKADESAIH